MNRRTALQFVASMFVLAKGEPMGEQQTGSPLIRLADFKPTSLRFHLDPAIRLELSVGDEVIEIPKDELIAALRPVRGDR